MKLEAERYLRQAASTKEVAKAPADKDEPKEGAAKKKVSDWDDDDKQKTEWSTDSEDEVNNIWSSRDSGVNKVLVVTER